MSHEKKQHRTCNRQTCEETTYGCFRSIHW